MKPLAVLGFVGVAIAALLFVLLSDPVAGTPDNDPAPVLLGMNGGSSKDGRTKDVTLTDSGDQEYSSGTANMSDVADREAVGSSSEILAGAFSNRISGTALDIDGQPIEGATITLLKSKLSSQFSAMQMAMQLGGERKAWTTYSATNGTFSFTSLPPGTDYSVSAEHQDFMRKQTRLNEVLPEGETIVSLTMGQGYTLSGIVMDNSDGSPVANADLLLQDVFALMPGADPNAGHKVRTGPDGSYSFNNVSSGTRNLTVRAEGYGSRSENNINFSGPVADVVNRDFRLDQGQCLSGRVIGPDQVGIAGATIEVTSYETSQTSRGSGRTDSNGYFRICDLAEGNFMLIARAQGFSDQRLTRVAITDEAQVTMVRQGGVMGLVVSIDDQKPVQNFVAKVRIVAPGSTVYGRTASQSRFTNEEGTFELGGLEAGNYVIQIEAEGFAPTYSESFLVAQGLVTPDVRVAVSQGGAVSGRLVDASTGEPITGAIVETFDNNYVSNPFSDLLGGMVPRTTTLAKTRTDKDGAFSIELLSATTYQLQIDHDDFPRKIVKDVQVREGVAAKLGTIRLASGGSIRGSVYDGAGRTLANAKISLTGQTLYPGNVHSDDEGRFVLKNVQEGTYRLAAVRPGDNAGNPFGPIIDMKKSEVTITIFEGREITQNLTIGN